MVLATHDHRYPFKDPVKVLFVRCMFFHVHATRACMDDCGSLCIYARCSDLAAQAVVRPGARCDQYIHLAMASLSDILKEIEECSKLTRYKGKAKVMDGIVESCGKKLLTVPFWDTASAVRVEEALDKASLTAEQSDKIRAACDERTEVSDVMHPPPLLTLDRPLPSW